MTTTKETSFATPLTPYCVVDYKKCKKNADDMLARARLKGVEFRPHVKTHKTLEGTLMMTGGKCGVVELDYYLFSWEIQWHKIFPRYNFFSSIVRKGPFFEKNCPYS